jgi:hypothetical protein
MRAQQTPAASAECPPSSCEPRGFGLIKLVIHAARDLKNTFLICAGDPRPCPLDTNLPQPRNWPGVAVQKSASERAARFANLKN